MAVRVDIEIPVMVLTTTQTGNRRVIARRTVIEHRFEELDESSVRHVATVQSRALGLLEFFKYEHQFYRVVGPRPATAEMMPSLRGSFHNQNYQPGTQLLQDIEHLFDGVPLWDLGQAWSSEARDTAKDISTVRPGTYDTNQVHQQIEIRRAALDHVVAGKLLLKPVDEPHINVDKGVCVSRLTPTQGSPGRCFSFPELDQATELGHRVDVAQYQCDTFEIFDKDAFTDTYLDFRMASVLNELENVFSRKYRAELARSILALTEADRALLASILAAYDRYKSGEIDEAILDTAEAFLNSLATFDVPQHSDIVYSFLREQWANRAFVLDTDFADQWLWGRARTE